MTILSSKGQNFCQFERFELPVFGQGLVWLGGDNRDSVAAGSNGSGKSNLMGAVGWCLFGKTVAGGNVDSVIREGTKSCWVSTRFRGVSGKKWVVKRSRSKGAPRLEMRRGKQRVDLPPDELQAMIEKELGRTWDTYRTTGFHSGSDRSKFVRTSTSDGERKAILQDLIGVDFAEARDWIKRKIKKLSEESVRLKAQMQSAERAVQDSAFHQLQSESRLWDEMTRRRRKLAASDVAQIRADLKAVAEKIESAHVDPARMQRLELARSRIEGEIRSLKKDLQEVAVEVDVAAKARAKAQSAVAIIKDKFRALGDDRCPTCEAQLTRGRGLRYVQALQRMQIEASESLHHAVERWESERRVRLGHQTAIEKKEAKLKKLADEERMALRHRADIAQRASAAESMKERLIAAQAKLRSLREEENPHRKLLKAEKRKLEERKAEVEVVGKKLKKLRRKLAHFEFWKIGYSTRGMPAMLLDNVLGELNESMDRYLEKLTDGDIEVKFTPQRELASQKGQVREEIGIEWNIEGSVGYPPSSGQWRKMEIACDLALMDVAAAYRGARSDVLFFDEALDGLDEIGRGLLVELLKELAAERTAVFVVSHDADIAEIFEHSMKVVKKNGIAELKVAT